MTSTPTPELLANLFRIELFDQLSLIIADRLKPMLQGENIELEAKFGKFLTNKGEPYLLPDLEKGLYPLIYTPQPTYRFISEVPSDRFHHLLKIVLNGRAEHYRVTKTDPEIKYIQTHTIDYMYSTNDPGVNIRVTKNLQGEVLACITKQDSIGSTGSHINILNNKDELDCRISVKREIPSELPPNDAKPFNTREKIRSSYQVGLFSIDLTDVPVLDQTTGQKISAYEVEIEVLPQYIPMFRQSLDDYVSQKNRSNFIKMVRSLVLTIQTLLIFSNPKAPLPALCRIDGGSGELLLKKAKPFDSTQSSAAVTLTQGGLAGESRM